MKKTLIITCLALLFSALLGWGQEVEQVNTLVINESEAASLAIGVMAGFLELSGLMAVDIFTADVESSFDIPISGNSFEKCYDLIIIVPREMLTLKQIWLVTLPVRELRPGVLEAIQFIKDLLTEFAARFQFDVKALSVSDDLIPGFFSTIFQRSGLLCPSM